MKTTNNTAPAKMDAAAEVKLAVESSPSNALITAAKTKLGDLMIKADKEAEQIARLSKAHAASKGDTEARAADLIAGKEIEDRTVSDAIQAAYRRADVISEAIKQQTRTVRELEVKLSGEVTFKLKKARQLIVDRIAAALGELRAAADEDAKIGAELSRLRINCADRILFSPVSYNAYDAQWFASVKAQGYTA